MNAIEYVSYRVVEDCNAGPACKARCLSQETVLQETAPFHQVRDVLDALWVAGVRKINLMGGEATLHPNISDIARHAKDTGFEVILSTNAIDFPPSKMAEMIPYLDWVSLSLDADTERVNDRLRGARQWKGTLGLIDWMAAQPTIAGKIKLNTQVTALTHTKIDGILDATGRRVAVWKLLQWIPRAEAKRVMDTYAVTPDVFATTVARLKNRYKGFPIVGAPYPEAKPDKAIVRPDGTVEINGLEFDYQAIGNILAEDPAEVFARAAQIFPEAASGIRDEFSQVYRV